MTGLPRASHVKMDARLGAAAEFFEVTGAELIPFVSDEATWYDFDYLEIDQLVTLVEHHYGIRISEPLLRRPFWEFLDVLADTRTM